MRASFRPLVWTAAVVSSLALPAAARAQQPLDPVKVSARAAEADDLDARAIRYAESNSRRDWRKAAGLREKAARLRAPGDPRGFSSLQTASLIRHALNERLAAMELMQRAGDHAMAYGDVFNASAAYANLAYMAAEQRDPHTALYYAEKGAQLAQSPLLSPTQREWLQLRFAQGNQTLRTLAVAPEIR